MSRGDGKPPSDGDDEDIGYGKPPKRTRFKRNESGNPKGRPKGSFGKHHLPDVILQRAREIFIREGNRKLRIREGDRVINLTAYEAAVRAAHMSAAKGSAMAQRTVIQERLRIESAMSEIMCGAFREMIAYKEDCARERLRCRKAGLPPPVFAMNPDDFVLDWESLTVHYQGPLAEQLQGTLRERQICRDDWAEDFQLCRERCKDEPQATGGLVLALQSQRNYDLMNESLPPRCRKPLTGRFSHSEVADALERLRKQSEQPKTGGSQP